MPRLPNRMAKLQSNSKVQSSNFKVQSNYIRRCIQLARNGQLNAAPNPMVGAVIVCNGRIIGEGYHVRCGEGHAEVNAIASVKPEDRYLLPQSTIYVSLEPCAHYGKTPPCAKLIIDKGIRKCVVGCIDPFSKVQGRGIQMLREAGVEVTVGILEKECEQLNKRFMTFHRVHRPFITLKWAQTADGFIGRKNRNPDEPLIISNTLTRIICHRRRAEHQAILVGRHTVETDNPSLNVREWTGPDPIPVVIGDRKKLKDNTLHLLQDERNTLFFHSPQEALKELYDRQIQSLLVEGGRETLQSFIDLNLWDEAFVETGTQTLSDGIPAPVLKNATLTATRQYGKNTIAAFKRSE